MTTPSNSATTGTTPSVPDTNEPSATAVGVLALPDTLMAHAALAAVTADESTALANHSIRSFLFARLLARHRGAIADHDYDEQLLFAACVLHDLGLGAGSNSDQRFEVDGADRAARLLTDQGLPAPQVDAVWQAIALHTSFGITERRGLLCELTRNGVGMDFGYGVDMVTDEQAVIIHTAYPRLSMVRSLVDAIVDQATRTPAKAPRYSVAAILARERTAPPHLTGMELAAATSRWGAELSVSTREGTVG